MTPRTSHSATSESDAWEANTAASGISALMDNAGDEVFRRLVDSVRDYAIFMLTREGFIASWNTGAERIKGYSADEIIGRHFSIFYTPEAQAAQWPAEELRRAERLGHFEDEGWRIRKDGSRFWANVILSPLRSADGELLGFSKVTRDLTERRHHEEALRRREDNLRLLVEGVKDHAIFLMDADGMIRTWNPGAVLLFGLPPADAISRHAAMLYRDQERAAGKDQSDFAAARNAGSFQGEGWRRRADGTAFWAEVAVNVLRNQEDEIVGFVQIVRDLSQRRRVEELESEGRHLYEFIAMLSHELRNPLAPIRNAVAILRKFSDRPEVNWSVDLIGRQVAYMTRLVDDLLEVSRITTGKIRIDQQVVQLNDVVSAAMEAASGAMDQHRHTLLKQVTPQPVSVTGDRTRLTQVLVNLLSNACKYTPDGGLITVSLQVEGAYAVLQVKDSGIGMTEALMGRAFEPFVQATQDIDRAEGGLGIGLSLVKSIVELHRGSATAASAGLGQGSTFTVVLPLVQNQQASAEGAAPIAQAPRARVLVVDDNRDAADSIAMLLELEGHNVAVAADGPRALEAAAANRPDIVLLDIGLPGMDGFEVARRMRQLPGLAKICLVAVTGYGQPGDKARTATAGFDAHLIKPVDPEEMTRLISGLTR